MYYFIHGIDAVDSLNARKANRPAHLARLQILQAESRLLCAGPLPAVDAEDPGEAGFVGSVIIAEFASLDAARAWAQDDPYLHAGVYCDVLIQPFRKVLP